MLKIYVFSNKYLSFINRCQHINVVIKFLYKEKSFLRRKNPLSPIVEKSFIKCFYLYPIILSNPIEVGISLYDNAKKRRF